MVLILTIVFLQEASGQITIPSDWTLTSRQAKEMIDFFNNCRGDCFTSKATPDTAKEAIIRANFAGAKAFTWIDARYRAEDVDRYASRNWQVARTGGTKVAGYTTQILQVTDKEGRAYYFDIAAICPPPSICDAREGQK